MVSLCASALVVLMTAMCLPAGIPARYVPTVSSSQTAKGWKGLVPLRSMRRDVEALLGPPESSGGSSYQTNEARIYVEYSDGPCEKGWPYGWNVDKDTLVSITVSAKHPVWLSELNLDQNKYVKSRGTHISSRIFYVNYSEGITVEADEFSGKVGSFTYHPTRSEQKLQCPDASSRLPAGRDQADSFFKFDAYGDLSPQPERERLDSVAAELLRRPETEAYVIAYAGRVAQKGEAAAHAACAGSYLTKKHRIQADRIHVIDGGYRDTREVEIYVEEKDGPLPLARPSVRPSAVQISNQKPELLCRLNAEN